MENGEKWNKSPEFDRAQAALSGMREWMRAHDGRIARRIPSEYVAALETLETIHAERALSNPDERIPEDAPKTLLANYARYGNQSATAASDSDLSFRFLSELYNLYTIDVKFFQNNGIDNIAQLTASTIALCHDSHSWSELQSDYHAHDLFTLGDLKTALKCNSRNPRQHLEEWEQRIARFIAEIEPRLREEYGQPGAWAPGHIKLMCNSPNPESIARDILNTVKDVCTKYPRADKQVVERWATGHNHRKKIKTLLQEEFPKIDLRERDMASAREDLMQLREARLAGNISGQHHWNDTPDVYKFVNTIHFNWQPSFDDLDIENNARRIHHTTKLYNKALSKEDQRLKIDDGWKNLYGIFCQLADDIVALKLEGPPYLADTVAQFHGPGIYVKYREDYKDNPLLPKYIIDRYVGENPTRIESSLENYIERVKEVHNANPQLGKFATKLALGYNSQAYVNFAETAASQYPWMTRSDMQRCFFRRDREAVAAQWAENLETIAETYPNDPRFPFGVRKRIAYSDDLALAIEKYLSRYNNLRTRYRNNPIVTGGLCAQWAINNPNSYNTTATEFLSRVEKIHELLDDAGEEYDDYLLRNLAVRSSKVEMNIKKYRETKYFLRTQFVDNDLVENWMIDQVAATSIGSHRHAEYKLRYLIRLKRAGRFNISIDTPVGGTTRSRHEIVSSNNWKDDPEAVAIHTEQAVQRRTLISNLLSGLNETDRLAVEVVFGFSTDYSKTALQEEIGIDDLDEYVMNAVIPSIRP